MWPSDVLRRTARGVLAVAGLEIRRARPPAATGEPDYSNFGEQDAIAGHLRRLGVATGTFVDIGAADGHTSSNTRALARVGWRGLAVEGDAETFARLAWRAVDTPAVQLARAFVTPDNVVALLEAHGVPADFAFLSLDIDGFDHFVLAALLKSFRPLLMCVEFNEAIPPPVKFTVTFHPDHVWARDHFYGQSLAMLETLATRHDYALVDVHYNNAFLVPAERSVLPGLPAHVAYRRGYLDRADRLKRLPWNAELERWQTLPAAAVVGEIRARFERYAGRYICEV
jgi:hypothetical protein